VGHLDFDQHRSTRRRCESDQPDKELRLTRILTRLTTGHLRHAVKTGVAAVACLYVTALFQLPQGYWAAISAMIVLQSSVGATVNASLNRFAGTAIGAVLGGLFAKLWGGNVWAFGAAATITVWLCASLGLRDSYRLASATVAIVMLTSRAGSPWAVALHRFLDIALGILVALLITLLMWPSRARDDLRRALAETLRCLEALYQAVVQRYCGGAAPSLGELTCQVNAALGRYDDLLKQAAYEPGVAELSHEGLTALREHLTQIWWAIEALELATRGGHNDTYHRRFEPELGQLLREISAAFHRLAKNVAMAHGAFDSTDLDGAVSALDDKATAIRTSGVSMSYSLEEVSRFYAFLISVKSLVKALEWTGNWRLPGAPALD
jgi:uncharacterized membrane protein YccC